jgi:outer membrane protein assembly factor BamB
MWKETISTFVVLLLIAATTSGAPVDSGTYWPAWRGPLATGEAPHTEPPVTWSEDTNIRWKVTIPGKGLATPVVWGDSVFVLTAVPTDKEPAGTGSVESTVVPERMKRMLVSSKKVQQFVVMAISRKDGSVQWSKTVRETRPSAGTHRDNTWASGSPLTDGKHLFAFFGSEGLFCLDLTGKLVWEKDLGDMTTKMNFGEGSTPVLCDDKIIINWDHEGKSFLTALSKADGKELWRVDRTEQTSWATPLVVDWAGKKQVIVSATKRICSYDADDGTLIWECGGMTANVIPSPMFANGTLYAMSGFRGNACVAIKLAAAKGDITDSKEAILWRHDQNMPYVPSALLSGGLLYFLAGNHAKLSCLKAGDGTVVYGPEKLEGLKGAYASIVGGGGRLYVAARNGVTAVIKQGPTFEVLAVNKLDTTIDASFALVGKELYIRGTGHLYCVAAAK